MAAERFKESYFVEYKMDENTEINIILLNGNRFESFDIETPDDIHH